MTPYRPHWEHDDGPSPADDDRAEELAYQRTRDDDYRSDCLTAALERQVYGE